MSANKIPQEKTRLHLRNRNREPYDLDALMIAVPELKAYVGPNKYGNNSVDFSNPSAVKSLNKALLNHYYGIKNWDFPDENLCPPIPGRADYLHNIADLLCENNFGKIPTGDQIKCLDIGVGASCIYPVIGVTEYGWNFIGADVNASSLDSSQKIIDSNSNLKGKIECRLQKNSRDIFKSVIGQEEKVDVTICNPPFHASLEAAKVDTKRKIKNLAGKNVSPDDQLKLAGIGKEMIYAGGEFEFIQNIIRDSKSYSKNCFWFSSLVSKQSNVKAIQRLLHEINAYQVKTIPMGTGNKSTRIIAWSFLTKKEQKEWKESRWKL